MNQKRRSGAHLLANMILLGALLTSLHPILFRAMLYHMDNPFLPTVREDKVQVACVGDSITFGAGVSMRSCQSYPAYLQKYLGREYHVQNYGLSGRTLLSSGDTPYVEERFYGASHERVSDIYLIMLGSNDTKQWNWDSEAYAREMKEFVRGYQELEGQPDVYLMIPVCAFPAEGETEAAYGIRPDVMEEELLPILHDIADETGVTLIDLYHLFEDHPEWMADGVHPNAQGNRQIALEITRYLVPSDDTADAEVPERS